MSSVDIFEKSENLGPTIFIELINLLSAYKLSKIVMHIWVDMHIFDNICMSNNYLYLKSIDSHYICIYVYFKSYFCIYKLLSTIYLSWCWSNLAIDFSHYQILTTYKKYHTNPNFFAHNLCTFWKYRCGVPLFFEAASQKVYNLCIPYYCSILRA